MPEWELWPLMRCVDRGTDTRFPIQGIGSPISQYSSFRGRDCTLPLRIEHVSVGVRNSFMLSPSPYEDFACGAAILVYAGVGVAVLERNPPPPSSRMGEGEARSKARGAHSGTVRARSSGTSKGLMLRDLVPQGFRGSNPLPRTKHVATSFLASA